MLPPPPPPAPHTGSVPAEKERARNWEERKQQSNWAQGRPTHGSETSPNKTHNKTQGNHEVRALQQPPNAAHAERAISKHPPPLPLQGAYVLHKGGGCTQGFWYFRGRKITKNHGNRPTLKITEITEIHGKARKRK